MALGGAGVQNRYFSNVNIFANLWEEGNKMCSTLSWTAILAVSPGTMAV
jgi:hypothetical protein